jgi:hypothetical protein
MHLKTQRGLSLVKDELKTEAGLEVKAEASVEVKSEAAEDDIEAKLEEMETGKKVEEVNGALQEDAKVKKCFLGLFELRIVLRQNVELQNVKRQNVK